ncbi:MAG: hypothetical protein OXB93_01255 [Cytophagales bacterium]|nr:hypothetical protein [Cytophagales bacterium]
MSFQRIPKHMFQSISVIIAATSHSESKGNAGWNVFIRTTMGLTYI